MYARAVLCTALFLCGHPARRTLARATAPAPAPATAPGTRPKTAPLRLCLCLRLRLRPGKSPAIAVITSTHQDAPPTRWLLNNDAAFRAVLRTAPDDSKAEPSYHHGDAWQTSAPSLHCHLRRRFPRRCSTLPRVPRRSHEATPRPSVGAPLTIISPYGKPCFQHGTA